MADSYPNSPTLPGGDGPADSPPIGSGTPTAMPDEEDAKAEMPLTMAASVVLTSLPKDATEALANAGVVGVEKVTVRFRAVGSAPALRQQVAKVSTTQRFETVVRFLRRRLRAKDHESVFCYVNSVFAPGLDENVGNLWRCFKTKDELVISYSITQAYG